MKYVFTAILLIHGFIHLLGFFKAYQSTDISKQVLGISKPIGAVWMITTILFISVAVSFLKNGKWFYLAFAAILLSQCLIIISWQEAKYGTIINGIILIISISAFQEQQFYKMVHEEVNQLFQDNNLNKAGSKIDIKKLSSLPSNVQKWLQQSGVTQKEEVVSVRLTQKGTMLTKAEGKWMPFKATQYFNIENPAFVWHAEVDAISIIKLIARDKFVNGKGEMLIKLASLFPVVNESNKEKLNSGTAIRFLSEMCWFPSAALDDYITWEKLSEHAAKAIFSYGSKSVSGIFTFNTDGSITSFEANRYYGAGENATLQKWVVTVLEHQVFNGVKIPSKCIVTWKLSEGNFSWLRLEITDVKYNLINY